MGEGERSVGTYDLIAEAKTKGIVQVCLPVAMQAQAQQELSMQHKQG
jgi:hypothetical protein